MANEKAGLTRCALVATVVIVFLGKISKANSPCIAKGGDCVGKLNGNYPKCFPECQSGYYVTWSNNLDYDMPCPLGWYTDKNNSRYLDLLVFNPQTNTCELKSSSCPREPKEHDDRSPTEKFSGNFLHPEVLTPQPIDPPGCIRSRNGCIGRRNGNYPACHSLCQEGYYYSCSNGLTYQMPCALGWYTFANGTRFTARMVYNRSINMCDLAVADCPRNPKDHVVPFPTPSPELKNPGQYEKNGQ